MRRYIVIFPNNSISAGVLQRLRSTNHFELYPNVFFVRGEFNDWAWQATSSCLALSMLGLPGMACSTVVMRALYALSMPRQAFKVTLFSVLSTAIFSLILIYPMSYNGLALAPGIAFTLSGILGLYYVKNKLGRNLHIFDLKLVGDYLISLAVIDISVLIYKYFIPYAPDARLLIRALWILGVIAVSASSYSIVTIMMKFNEWKWIKDAFTKK